MSTDKTEANVQAAAALRGVAVTPIDDDRGRRVFIVSQWSLCKQCDSLDEVRALLRRMGIET